MKYKYLNLIFIALVFNSCLILKIKDKKYLAKNWVVINSVPKSEICQSDTLKFINDWSFDNDSLSKLPTFIFYRFSLINREGDVNTSKKNNFSVCFNPNIDSSLNSSVKGVRYNFDVTGGWRLGLFKSNQLTLKKIKEEKTSIYNENNKKLNKIVYTIIYLDKDKMTLVRKFEKHK